MASSLSIDEARDLYYRGADGDKDATHRSLKLFTELAGKHPEDPLVKAYSGSNKLLEAGRTFALWTKNRLSREGLTELDQAVAAAPENFEVRFLRAVSTYHLPAFFRREDQCDEDLKHLVRLIRQDNAGVKPDKKLAAAALYYFGLMRERKYDNAAATEAWKEASKLSPDTPAGRKAAAKLMNVSPRG